MAERLRVIHWRDHPHLLKITQQKRHRITNIIAKSLFMTHYTWKSSHVFICRYSTKTLKMVRSLKQLCICLTYIDVNRNRVWIVQHKSTSLTGIKAFGVKIQVIIYYNPIPHCELFNILSFQTSPKYLVYLNQSYDRVRDKLNVKKGVY